MWEESSRHSKKVKTKEAKARKEWHPKTLLDEAVSNRYPFVMMKTLNLDLIKKKTTTNLR